MSIYEGDWSTHAEFVDPMDWDDSPPDATDAEVIYARYDTEPYEGESWVLYARDGKLYENHSSHCSCNGLSWSPEETTPGALLMRPDLPDAVKNLLSAAAVPK